MKKVDRPLSVSATGKKRGHSSYVPTEETRSKVRKLALVPIPPVRIAAALGISELTHQKHYGDIIRKR